MEVVKVNVKDENESYLFLVNDLDCLKKQGWCTNFNKCFFYKTKLNFISNI